MITRLTIRCDWPGCTAELTYEFRTLRPRVAGWKTESDGLFSLHLCRAHWRKTWFQVRDEQVTAGQPAPSTGRHGGA